VGLRASLGDVQDVSRGQCDRYIAGSVTAQPGHNADRAVVAPSGSADRHCISSVSASQSAATHLNSGVDKHDKLRATNLKSGVDMCDKLEQWRRHVRHT
jgi:hypothetical protein